jgi:copper transport protein
VRDVELRFDEAVGVGLGSVRVIGANGQRVDAGVVYHPGSDRQRVAVRLRDGLATGSYLVLWRVVSADSHPVSGSFSFAVGLPGPIATDITDSSGLTVPVMLGVARFAGLAGVLLLTGAIVFLIVCWPAGWRRNRARRLVWDVLIAGGVGSAIELVVQAVYDVGGTMSSVFNVAPLQALLGTRFGHAHVIRLVALLAAAGLIGVLLRPPAVGGGELTSPAMANDDLRAVEVGAQRFSRLAPSCVVILVGTGVVQAWHQIGELAALRATHYGQLLIVKVIVVAVILGFAAVSRSAVRARTDTGIRTLSRSVAAEAVLGVVVVAVTAVLVATTPARVAYRPTIERTLHSGPITLQLTAVPDGSRQLDLHLYTFGADGLTTAVVGVHGDAALPSRHLGPIALAPLTAGPGHFIANQVLLPAAGDWTVHLYVRASEFDSYTFITRLMVR